jgi:hypothetical protein
MAKINITITASVAEFSTFADELGYQATVQKSSADIALLPQPVAIQDTLMPNPQDKTAFLLAYFKNITTTELARVKIANIQKTVDVQKELDKIAMRTAIDNAVAVTVA